MVRAACPHTVACMSMQPDLASISTAVSGAAAQVIAGRFDDAAQIIALAGLDEQPCDAAVSVGVALLASYVERVCGTIGLDPATFPDRNPASADGEDHTAQRLWFAAVCAARGTLLEAENEVSFLVELPARDVAAACATLLAGLTRWRADVLGVEPGFLASQLCLHLARL